MLFKNFLVKIHILFSKTNVDYAVQELPHLFGTTVKLDIYWNLKKKYILHDVNGPS